MTLFEQLKLFPKVDLHINFLGSIMKTTISKLNSLKMSSLELDDILDFDSLKDYDTSRKLAIDLFKTVDDIELAANDLTLKLKEDNIIYAEVFLNLELFKDQLNKNEIVERLINIFTKSTTKINIVLEIDSSINIEELKEELEILYKYYNKGINGIFFKKGKQENIDSYKALFDKFLKDKIDYIVLLDSRLTNQNKEIYYNAKRIIYNLMERPEDNFLNIIRDNDIILEFPITYQNYFNLYDELSNHFVYDLYKENIRVAFTTYDMTSLDTDILNEYCKLFNAFPFNLHDLVNITLNILNKINTNDEIKNNLILEFKEKANELL